MAPSLQNQRKRSPTDVLNNIEFTNKLILALGLFISTYGFYVEYMMDNYPDYLPFCDISHLISCTKALHSDFGTGFGIVGPLLGKDHFLNQKNALYGLIFYVLLLVLQSYRSKMTIVLSFAAAVVMNLMTVYLVGLLYKLGTVCIVCFGIYIVNFLFLVFESKRYKAYFNQKSHSN